jgi:hypothetical protein
MAYESILFDMVERYIDNDPRTLQTAIGPSGAGSTCYHCLGAMIAEEPRLETSEDRWLSFIGKAVHDHLAKACEFDNAGAENPGRWLVEQRVRPGMILDQPLEGNSDCFDTWEGRVIDWKVVGDRTLNDVRQGYVSDTYLNQADLYGLGFEGLGWKVTNTTIMFLPRNRYRLREGIPVHRPYNRMNAVASLKRCNDIAALLREHGAAYVLPRLKRDPSCKDCPRYAR